MPTIATDPKVLAANYNRAFNAHDEVALKALFADNARLIAPGDVKLTGKDAIAGYTNSWMKAVPDARINVTHEIVSGPWVVQEFVFAGTHTGPLTSPMGTIQATNRKVSGQSVSITRSRERPRRGDPSVLRRRAVAEPDRRHAGCRKELTRLGS